MRIPHRPIFSVLSASTFLLGSIAVAASPPEHATIASYDGPATCVECHPDQASQAFSSVHYQWMGPTSDLTNFAGDAGKKEGSFNSYCGSVVTSLRAACWTCHSGNGAVPTATESPEQLANIDCLTCHQEKYRRQPAGPLDVSIEGDDNLGQPKIWQFMSDETLLFTPNEAAMGITSLEAAQTVHRPTRAACLSCHATAGGGDGVKRGDLAASVANASAEVDYHLSPEGANLLCQDCHDFDGHHVLGRGVDLRPTDRAGRLACDGCHGSAPHDDDELDRHTARVACQSCHIPTYARYGNTEVQRDWTTPVWKSTLLGGQGGFEPTRIEGTNLTPTYEWFDGTSRVYISGQDPEVNDAGEIVLAAPNGSVETAGSKIHPMKEHRANAARLDSTGGIIPHSTLTFFTTGSFDQAVQAGMDQLDLAGPWSQVTVLEYQSLNHGVASYEDALECGACHEEYAEDDGALRMDLQGNMGYAPRAPTDVICSQCHGEKSPNGFEGVHSRHVWSKGYDCSWCHDFARLERGLKVRPGASIEDTLTVTKHKVKHNDKKPAKDTLSIQGAIYTADPEIDLSQEEILIRYGTFEQLIPSGGAERNGTKPVFKAKSPKGELPTYNVTFDFSKSTYKVSVKKADLELVEGSVPFGIRIGSIFDETVQVPAP